jgi:hypothetical protein
VADCGTGLGSLGVYILISSLDWILLGDETDLALQVLGFYVLYVAARFPSVVIAGLIIAQTELSRPYVVSFITVCSFEMVMLGIRLMSWPWAIIPTLPTSVPITGELVGILILSAIAAIGAHFGSRFRSVNLKDNNQMQDICA